MTPIFVDDVLADPLAYRAEALTLPFGDVTLGGEVFHGIVEVTASPLFAWLQDRYGLTTTASAFRLSPQWQQEPHYVHHDRMMGAVTAILYLNPHPPETDGTRFFEHRTSGARAAMQDDGMVDWDDMGAWICWDEVPAAFNRIVLFDAALYHARSMFSNYGTDRESARLIQVSFCDGELPLS